MSAYLGLNQQWIAGQWTEGHSALQLNNLNPYDQTHIFSMQAASIADVDAAYTAAAQAYQQGKLHSIAVREQLIAQLTHVMHRRREEIIDWLITESGSTRFKANIEVDAALAVIQEAASFPKRMQTEVLNSADPTRHSEVIRQPLGVIAVISPWNFPLHLSMRSVVTAIACGNTVVLKPASDTPVTGGTLLGKLFEEAGAPAGTLNVIVGTGQDIGDYFVQHRIPCMISFTGSTAIGKRVAALAVSSPRLKRLALELGGNAALVVLDDADLDLAVELTLMGRFLHQGQICMSTNRVIVQDAIYERFVEKLLQQVQQLQYGDPALQQTLIGPIINAQQLQQLQAIVQQAQLDGAKLIFSADIQGNVMPPHIFTEVDPSSALAQNESFGPILPILRAVDDTHALCLANDTEYGLSSAVCSGNLQRAKQFAQGIEAGMTHINAISIADHANAPFGGEKNSGLGRFNGRWILEEFTRTHWLTSPVALAK